MWPFCEEKRRNDEEQRLLVGPDPPSNSLPFYPYRFVVPRKENLEGKFSKKFQYTASKVAPLPAYTASKIENKRFRSPKLKTFTLAQLPQSTMKLDHLRNNDCCPTSPTSVADFCLLEGEFATDGTTIGRASSSSFDEGSLNNCVKGWERDQHRRKLRCFYHATSCKATLGDDTTCSELHCSAKKRLLRHVVTCKVVDPNVVGSCYVPGCRQMKSAWIHYRKCNDNSCDICAVVPVEARCSYPVLQKKDIRYQRPPLSPRSRQPQTCMI